MLGWERGEDWLCCVRLVTLVIQWPALDTGKLVTLPWPQLANTTRGWGGQWQHILAGSWPTTSYGSYKVLNSFCSGIWHLRNTPLHWMIIMYRTINLSSMFAISVEVEKMCQHCPVLLLVLLLWIVPCVPWQGSRATSSNSPVQSGVSTWVAWYQEQFGYIA